MGLMSAQSIVLLGNRLTGSIPSAVGRWTSVVVLWIEMTRLRGTIPDSLSNMLALTRLRIPGNQLEGTIPIAMCQVAAMRMFIASVNQLSGSIATAIPNHLRTLMLGSNSLTGSLLDAIASLRALELWESQSNHLRSSLPEALRDMQRLRQLGLPRNAMSGMIPSACNRLSGLELDENNFAGLALEWALGAIPAGSLLDAASNLMMFSAAGNCLTGSLPDAMSDLSRLRSLLLGHNQLRGSLPTAIRTLTAFAISSNALRGTIPESSGPFSLFDVSYMKLTGSLPKDLEKKSWKHKVPGLPLHDLQLQILRCAGTMMEGRLPRLRSPNLLLLDASGSGDASTSLRGPLPLTLSRAHRLRMLVLHKQRLQGNIPKLASSLLMLVLHSNLFKALPDMSFLKASVILVHQNLLSCCLPRFQSLTTMPTLALAAFENQFWQPQDFPTWIAPVEKDGLFWASRTEGCTLGTRFLLCSIALWVVAHEKLGVPRALEVISRWQEASGHGAELAIGSVRILSCMALAALWNIVFLAALLNWNRYRCPRSLSLASACFRDSMLLHAAVVLLWGGLWWCFNLNLQKMIPRRRSRKSLASSTFGRCILCFCWFQVTLILSTLLVVHQAGKSVPAFYGVGGFLEQVLSLCIGGLLSSISKFIIPYLGRGLPPRMLFLEGLTSLGVSCVIPAAVIIYLDAACMGHWATLWKPCSPKHAGRFTQVLHCPDDYAMCPEVNHAQIYSDIVILTSSDICRPRRLASLSTCVQTVWLRLWEVWVSKWITTGLATPACELLWHGSSTSRSSTSVARQLASATELATIAAAPLPLLAPVLLSAMIGETFLAANAWAQGALQRKMHGGGIHVETWIAAQIVAVGFFTAFASADLFSSCLVAASVLVIAKGHGKDETTKRMGREFMSWLRQWYGA